MARPGTPAAARAACVRGERASAALPAAGLRSGERRAARLPPRTVPLRFPQGSLLGGLVRFAPSGASCPARIRSTPRATGAARTASRCLGRAGAQQQRGTRVGRWQAEHEAVAAGAPPTPPCIAEAPARTKRAPSRARTRGVGGGGGENVWTTRPAGPRLLANWRAAPAARRRCRRRGRQRVAGIAASFGADRPSAEQLSWAHFTARVACAPEQCLRYCFEPHARPLWPARAGAPARAPVRAAAARASSSRCCRRPALHGDRLVACRGARLGNDRRLLVRGQRAPPRCRSLTGLVRCRRGGGSWRRRAMRGDRTARASDGLDRRAELNGQVGSSSAGARQPNDGRCARKRREAAVRSVTCGPWTQ